MPTLEREDLPPAVQMRKAAPWLGRGWEHRQAAVAGFGSLAAGALYLISARRWAPAAAPGWIEFWGTVTSLWSVWITQRRNVLALPVGIVSVVLMGWAFNRIGLHGQAWLHWGYYVPVQFWAWVEWTRGGEDNTELQVTRLQVRMRYWLALLLLATTGLLGWSLETVWQDALHTYWDASIVAASVLAMALMSRKKVESWWLWILPVDVSAVGLYAESGAYMFAALYVLFLFMACVGLVRWQRAAEAGTA